MLAFLFLILLVTGVLLMLYYTPSVERAYASVKDIVFVVKGGRYIRNLHRWAGHAMVIVAFLHLLRTFFTGAYLRKRTLNWNIGIGMLIAILLLSFSGYLLPWDQLAYWAVTIGSNIAASARELTDALNITHLFDPGGFVKRLLIGDETVGQEALTRFYMLHIVFLPVILVVLMGWHFWRMRKDGGLSRPEITEESQQNVAGQNEEESGKIGSQKINLKKNESGVGDKKLRKEKQKDPHILAWPTLLWAELAILMFLCAMLMFGAFFFDAPLKEQANPMLPENPAKSPWYFLGVQELVSFSGFAGGIVVPLLFIFFLASIPFKDREDHHIGVWFSGSAGKKVSLYSMIFAFILTVAVLFINVNYGWLGDWIPGFPQLVVIFVNPGTLLVMAYIGWSYLIWRKYRSTRYAAMALFTCAVIGFVLLTAVGFWFRGPNWEFFWLKSQWPVQ
jgi:quinol-cytochrome oxidoreductase complex cytochrome b subunit